MRILEWIAIPFSGESYWPKDRTQISGLSQKGSPYWKLSSTQNKKVTLAIKKKLFGGGALGWPRGIGWGGRWEGGSGWGTHVNRWLIHVNVWQKPVQYCKVISLQLIKITGKNLKKFKTGECDNSLDIVPLTLESEASVEVCSIPPTSFM